MTMKKFVNASESHYSMLLIQEEHNNKNTFIRPYPVNLTMAY